MGFVAVGAQAAGSGATSVTAPAGRAIGNFLVLSALSSNQTISTPAGWDPVPNSPQGTGTPGDAAALMLATFYRWATGDTNDNASLADSGDFNYGIITALDDVPDDASDPWDLSYGGVDSV